MKLNKCRLTEFDTFFKVGVGLHAFLIKIPSDVFWALTLPADISHFPLLLRVNVVCSLGQCKAVDVSVQFCVARDREAIL